MKSLKTTVASAVLVAIAIVLTVSSTALAATYPSLGAANTYSVLSSSYINTAIGTVINGDLGYTTPPAVTPTVNGNTHVADGAYNQAGIDQATALAAINSQPCTYTFPVGAVDLASDTSRGGTTGEFSPGVYCVVGAASIGGGGTITLNGSGVYIFKSTGALNTSANSSVVATNGASACTALWAPAAATTIGANSTFIGTIIDPSGITVGSTVGWTGRALAFGGTVSTTTDTVTTTPVCAAPSAATTTTAALGSEATATNKTPRLPNTGLAAPATTSPALPIWSLPAAALGIFSIAYAVRRFI